MRFYFKKAYMFSFYKHFFFIFTTFFCGSHLSGPVEQMQCGLLSLRVPTLWFADKHSELFCRGNYHEGRENEQTTSSAPEVKGLDVRQIAKVNAQHLSLQRVFTLSNHFWQHMAKHRSQFNECAVITCLRVFLFRNLAHVDAGVCFWKRCSASTAWSSQLVPQEICVHSWFSLYKVSKPWENYTYNYIYITVSVALIIQGSHLLLQIATFNLKKSGGFQT